MRSGSGLVVLRVDSRLRDGTHFSDERNIRRPQQRDDLVDRASRMADRKEGNI